MATGLHKFRGEEDLRQDIVHKLVRIKRSYQILCMPAKGMTRRRNVSRTRNNVYWGNTTCPDCLKLRSTSGYQELEGGSKPQSEE